MRLSQTIVWNHPTQKHFDNKDKNTMIDQCSSPKIGAQEYPRTEKIMFSVAGAESVKSLKSCLGHHTS
jgi:hypothetical protein